MKLGNNPQSREHDIVIQELKDEILIYDLQKNKALCLNQTSAMVWQACDGTKSVTEISGILGQKLNTTVSEDVVWLALEQFKKDNLLAQSHEFTTPLDGLTRREIVRRIGFASMVALPMISTLLAPWSTQAHSMGSGACVCDAPAGGNLRPEGCPCTVNNDCCGVCSSGTCSPVTAPSACSAANCCPDLGSFDVCSPTAPDGCNARPEGAMCDTNDDCCGVCSGGTCSAITGPSAPTAKPCCFN